MKDIPLHDIKPLVEVPDNSLIYLSLLAIFLLVLLVLLVTWGWKAYKQSKAVNLRKSYLHKIHNVDMNDAKEAAYAISAYGKFLAKSDREIEMLANLDSRLSRYKYKKEVEAIDDETLGYYQLFLEVLDAS